MKTKLMNILIILWMLGLSACAAQPDTSGGAVQLGESVRSNKQRVMEPVSNASDQESLVSGNNAFAYDLYQELLKDDGNLFYSPYSISLALAMTYAGARSQTEKQMAEAMHFTLSQERLHPAFNSLDLTLTIQEEETGEGEEPIRLNIANSIWGQHGYDFKPDFLDTLAENYGAGLRLLDFVRATEKSRQVINDWVSDETEQKIQDLIPSGAIDTQTRLVLANAVYFNASWMREFKEDLTEDGSFYLLDGGEVTIPMMKQTETFRYTAGEGYQAIELPYMGNTMSMVVLLPTTGGFAAFENSLDSENMESILGSLDYQSVELTLPKFSFESRFSLANTLMDLGMPDAFSPGSADLSGMDGTRELFISDVVHKAFVAVDERGTEAAAATAVIVRAVSMPMPGESEQFIADHPFIFMVRDLETGTILFIGRVTNPES